MSKLERSVSGLPAKGLYVITDSTLAGTAGVVAQVRSSLQGGAKVVQYRDKSRDDVTRLAEARQLLTLCRAASVPLIINDDVALAQQIGADGVHLGRHDPVLGSARDRLGKHAIIGVSCYNRFELAEQAVEQGADYIAFGRFFSSITKPNAQVADLQLLQRARKELKVPVVAIGGITPENGGVLIAAGADLLAVIHAVFAQSDVKAACTEFNRLFENQKDSLR